AYGTLARTYELRGLHEKALETDWKGAPPEEYAGIKKIYAESGMPGVWRSYLKDALESADKGKPNQFSIASLYVQLGEKDKAFEWLNKSLDAHSIQFTYLIAGARFDSIRADPRYAALLQRVGLNPVATN